MSEDEFTPKLGKPGAKDGKRLVKYGGRVLAGASIGRLLSSRDRFAGARARRAMVKVRLVRIAGSGLAAARAHLRVANTLREELGKPFAEVGNGARVEGRLTRKVELLSGRYGLVERSREFTLVPWRPVLERQLGKPVAGVMRADGVNWHLGQSRSGPQIA